MLVDIFTQNLSGGWPNRTLPHLVALSLQTNLARRIEPQITYAQVEHFLYTRPSVEHQGEERVIAMTVWTRPVDAAQQGIDLIGFQIFNGGDLSAALELDRNNRLKSVQAFGLLVNQKARKDMDGSQTGIARGDAVVAFALP